MRQLDEGNYERFLLNLDYYEVLNLHKALLEAKFNIHPDNELVSGSLLVADVYIQVGDLLNIEGFNEGRNTMQYAIELYYDKKTESQLLNMAQKIADEKISTKFLEWKTRPHLTLACFNDVNEAYCMEKLKEFAMNHKVMPAYIGSVGMFNDTKTIFVSPVMNRGMYQFQKELHESLNDFDATGWEWYCPDSWVPHCTIALTADDEEEAFFRASDLLLRNFEKLSGEFVSIGLVKIAFPVEEIFKVDFSR